MAVVTQPVATLNEPTGTLTLSIAFNSLTLLVTSVTVVNNLGHDYTFSVTNPLGVSFPQTIAMGTTTVDLTAANWLINADASLADGWVFNG